MKCGTLLNESNTGGIYHSLKNHTSGYICKNCSSMPLRAEKLHFYQRKWFGEETKPTQEKREKFWQGMQKTPTKTSLEKPLEDRPQFPTWNSLLERYNIKKNPEKAKTWRR